MDNGDARAVRVVRQRGLFGSIAGTFAFDFHVTFSLQLRAVQS